MEPEAKIVENTITSHGLRVVHVVGYNVPVNVDDWIHLVPGESIGLLQVIRSEEPEISIHHLHLNWPAREMVQFSDAPIKHGALWYIDKGERMSYAIDIAASLFRMAVGVYPKDAWTRKLPDEAPTKVEIFGIQEEKPGPVFLHEGYWVPERYVCLGIPSKDAKVTWKDGNYSVEWSKK